MQKVAGKEQLVSAWLIRFHLEKIMFVMLFLVCIHTQWRNVISGGPRFKMFEGPLIEVPKARVKRHICMSFLGGPGHAHPENF
jgi:hypothetical protein